MLYNLKPEDVSVYIQYREREEGPFSIDELPLKLAPPYRFNLFLGGPMPLTEKAESLEGLKSALSICETKRRDLAKLIIFKNKLSQTP